MQVIMKGHDGVTASANIDKKQAVFMLGISISSPEKLADLSWALNRSINTFPEAPPWLFELCDLVDGVKYRLEHVEEEEEAK